MTTRDILRIKGERGKLEGKQWLGKRVMFSWGNRKEHREKIAQV